MGSEFTILPSERQRVFANCALELFMILNAWKPRILPEIRNAIHSVALTVAKWGGYEFGILVGWFNFDWPFMWPYDVIFCPWAVDKDWLLGKLLWLVETINLSRLSISSVSFLLNLISSRSRRLAISNNDLRQMFRFKLLTIKDFPVMINHFSIPLYGSFIVYACAHYLLAGLMWIIMKIKSISHQLSCLSISCRVIDCRISSLRLVLCSTLVKDAWFIRHEILIFLEYILFSSKAGW